MSVEGKRPEQTYSDAVELRSALAAVIVAGEYDVPAVLVASIMLIIDAATCLGEPQENVQDMLRQFFEVHALIEKEKASKKAFSNLD